MIPDAIEPIVGIRTWSTISFEGQMMGNIHRHPWVPDRRTEAICAGFYGSSHGVHDAPHPGCKCGLYVLRWPLPEDVAFPRVPDLRGGSIIGFAALWGKVVPGERTYRGQYGRPLVFVSAPCYDGMISQPSKPWPELEKMAELYGVPIADSWDEGYSLAVSATRAVSL